MSPRIYRERDYAFGQVMLTLRTAMHLTQVELAEFLHISRHAVQGWEEGGSYPKAEHLKQFIAFAVQRQAFRAGREAEEIRALWQAAHQKVLLDDSWLSALLAQASPPLPSLAPRPTERTSASTPPVARLPPGRRVEWGDALDVPTFYGRKPELALLTQWVGQERCRVVSVLGMGGIGKTALAVSVMHRVAEQFEVVFFRSLRDAPSCEALLDDCLQMFSPQPLAEVSPSLERRLNLLLEHLRGVRALLVLDNLEALLQEGETTGRLRPGYEGYGRLLRRVGETAHQSCLLVTSREKPAELVPLEGNLSPVRALHLSGLDVVASKQLLAEKGMVGTPHEWARLVEAYAGNPLALKIVAQTIVGLFGGEIGQFLSGGELFFGGIHYLLAEQFARLSKLEHSVLHWLAIVREPVSIDELLAVLIAPLPRVQLLEVLDSLRRRSLIEQCQWHVKCTLQSVVLEYVTAQFLAEVTGEIEQRGLDHLIEHALSQAEAKEYVRRTQERLIVAPLLERLRRAYTGRTEVEEQLLSLLAQLREQAEYAQGYGPANLMALLQGHRGHLRGLDLSGLAIQGAYLQGVEMQDASLVGAVLRDTVFTETFDATWGVATSPNGQYWAAGSRRGEVRVWAEGGQTLHLVWKAHTDTVVALAFSPDEQTLATASWDGAIKLWELERGSLLWTGSQTEGIESVAFAPDGHRLASGGNDAVVHLWDTASGTNVQTLACQGGAVFSVAWSPDGRLLASGCANGDISLWEMQETQSASCVKTLTGHTNWVEELAFAPDGTQLASASVDRTVRLWEVTSGCCLQTLEGHTDRVFAVAWSPDGRTVASAGFDKMIWLWDVERGRYRMALQGYTARMYKIAFTPDSRCLLSGSEDSALRVWDVASGQCVRIIQGYAVSFYDIDWSPDGAQLVSGGPDALVIIWDLVGGTPPRALRGHSWVVHGVGWSPDGRLLASCGWDNVIRLWDTATGACVHIFRDPDDVHIAYYSVAWSPDGQLLASGSYMRGVQLWDVTARTLRWVGRTQPTKIRLVAWSPDSTRLASCGDDGSVHLWEVVDGTLLQSLQGHRGMVASVVWSPDGTWLASGGGGRSHGELFVWDAQSGERVRVFARHPGVVYAVAWSPSGDLLVSGDSDGMLRWWDVQSEECLMQREGHQGAVQSLRISPNTQTLASCGEDGTIKLWDVRSAELLRTLRRDRPYERLNITATRGLTEAQRATLQALGAIEAVIPPL
jgi:WD40 repeat protein/transcriptional regulator with XRE-family HTH domain